MHAMLWRLEVGRQRANAIEQKALRRQRLLVLLLLPLGLPCQPYQRSMFL